MNKIISQANIDNAVLEAIYWWNRDEYYYHKYFSKLDTIFLDKVALDFFTRKIFEIFLREYSVRRNLSSGVENVSFFINELFENDFFTKVNNGETEVIDELSNILKENRKSTERNTRSLLSKVAFLINPHEFSLYDNLAKDSIVIVNKLRHYEVNSYSGFLLQIHSLKQKLSDGKFFKNSRKLLNQFRGTESYNFFSQHNIAFEMRTIDKFLWLYAQNIRGNKFNNNGYIKLQKI